MKNYSFLFLIFLYSVVSGFGQPNCNIYKWEKDTLCYNACLEAMKAIELEQGSRESQLHFDKAIELCPTFAYAYYEKAVPYLKRGEFVTWKKLIDKAVELNPTAHLGCRGCCRYKFIGDYEGAIKDIERLDSIIDYDLGYSVEGDYHLNILKALCYKGLDEKQKAIEIIEKQLSHKNYNALSYDYLHLGVLYLETRNPQKAIISLKKQLEINDYLAETYYYLALASKQVSNKTDYLRWLTKAKEYYLAGKKRTDSYVDPMDKIYLTDIENEIKESQKE